MHRAYIALMEDIETESHPVAKLTQSVYRPAPVTLQGFGLRFHNSRDGLQGPQYDKYVAAGIVLEPWSIVRTLDPQFIHSHSLRVGDVGWGFDREGCVSIAIVEEAEGFSNRSSVFVQKTERDVRAVG